MSWFTKIFSSSKAVDNVLDKDNGLLTQVGGWIGNMNYTPEEQAKMSLKVGQHVAAFVETSLSESTERSKTRRAVAILWIKAQLIMIFWVMLVAPFDIVLAKFYAEIVFGTLMISGTLSVIAFFFGPYMIGKHIQKPKTTKEQEHD